MRLGQLARKYHVSLQEIITYVKEVNPECDKLGRNSKLNEQFAAQVAKHFENLEELGEKTSEEIERNIIEPEATDVGQREEVPQSDLDVPLLKAEDQEAHKKDEVVIETDKLLELLESEETPVDLSKITLIKAPKKELKGLKVVGKIELPEPKSKTAEKSKQREKEPKPDRNARHQRRQLSEEELEKRRSKAKKRKEEYQARQEKRNKEKAKKQKEARYQQKLQRAKYNQQNKYTQPKDKTPRSSSEVKEQRPEPKTLLGKFWRWMNT